MDASGITIKRSLGEGSYGQVFEVRTFFFFEFRNSDQGHFPSSLSLNLDLSTSDPKQQQQQKQGTLSTPSGPARVVLKRMKPSVDGAAGFFEAEHLLNAYASRAAPGAVANFLGFTTVPSGSTAGFSTYSRLVEGATYLVWEYEGFKTLSYYLRRRDCDAALAADLGVPADRVAATVMRDVLRAAAQLHRAGIVHRDVKPENLILAEPALYGSGSGGGGGGGGEEAERPSSGGGASSTVSERPKTSRQRQLLAPRFKLIDLGAAAELRRGTGYEPDVGVLDPRYSPPERFILPTTAPSLSTLGAARVPGVSALLGSVLWGRHRPDTFDSYSAGVVLMQLAVPKLRTANALKAFNEALAKRGHDLIALRDEGDKAVGSLDSDVLDAADGAGWDLAASLLRARPRVTDDGEGNIEFGGGQGKGSGGGGGKSGGRPGADKALRHPFIAGGAVELADRTPGLNVSPSTTTTTAATTKRAVSPSAAAEKKKPAAAAAATKASSSSSAGVLSGAVSSVWRSATRRLFDLEASLVAQSDVVSTQTTRVQLARAKAEEVEAAGGTSSDEKRAAAAAAAELVREEEQLASATKRLRSLASDFERTAKRASDTLAGFWGGGGGGSSSAASSGVKATKSSGGAKVRTAAALAADVSAAAEEQESEVSATASSSSPVGSSIKAVAVGGVYSGLKYMGVALKVASALASSVAASAEEATAEAEAAASDATARAKKIVPEVERSAGLAFVDALRELDPPPAEGADWDSEVAPRLRGDRRFRAVPAAAAEGLYEAYTNALADAAARRAELARRGYETLLSEEARGSSSGAPSVTLTSLSWEAAATKWAPDPRFIAAVATGVDVRGRFHSKREEAARESAFVGLLSVSIARVLNSAPAGSRRRSASNLRWSDLRREIVDEEAFAPLAEMRRRELFAEQREALTAAERAAAAAEEAAAAEKRRALEEEAIEAARARAKVVAEAEAVEAAAAAALVEAATGALEEEAEEEPEPEPVAARAASAAAVGDFASFDDDDDDDEIDDEIDDDSGEEPSSNVEALRTEQAKLKAEYERMEEKLRAMEEALAASSNE